MGSIAAGLPEVGCRGCEACRWILTSNVYACMYILKCWNHPIWYVILCNTRSLSMWIFRLLGEKYFTEPHSHSLTLVCNLCYQCRMLRERMISYREQTVGSQTHISFNHLQSAFPSFFFILLSRTLKTGFFISCILCYITVIFHPCHCSCLSLMSSCLSFIPLFHALPHSALFACPHHQSQINYLQLLGHATFVPRAVKLKIIQIECVRAIYINQPTNDQLRNLIIALIFSFYDHKEFSREPLPSSLDILNSSCSEGAKCKAGFVFHSPASPWHIATHAGF